MQENFDNAGVFNVQQRILGLPKVTRELEIAFIRTDFIGWMKANFALRPSQQRQLESIDPDMRENLAQAIADHYEQGISIQFYKETRKGGDDDLDFKEYVVTGLPEGDETPAALAKRSTTPLSVWIRYRS